MGAAPRHEGVVNPVTPGRNAARPAGLATPSALSLASGALEFDETEGPRSRTAWATAGTSMLILALISTVVLLVWMGFFMMGSLPLLILKHDTPIDSRFIRGLFNVYYVAIMATAAVGALSCVLAGRFAIALALSGVAGVGFAGRHWLVSRMDRVRSTMTPDDTSAIGRFRRLHITGMLLNVALLAVFCVGLTRVSF